MLSTIYPIIKFNMKLVDSYPFSLVNVKLIEKIIYSIVKFFVPKMSKLLRISKTLKIVHNFVIRN